jgi:sugar/nucleoside kinase (ribokinase family)
MIEMFSELSSPAESVQGATPVYGAMLFGYPHLLPMMQGGALSYIFSEARKIMIDSGIVALDLNGVPEAPFATSGGLRNLGDLKNDRVIGPALGHVDLLHMNEDELVLLTGCRMFDSIESERENEFTMAKAVELFLDCGVAVVAVTRGMKGSYVACNNAERFQKTPML